MKLLKRIMKEPIIIESLKYKTILSYCLKCKKNTESLNPRVSKTSNRKTKLLSKCVMCESKKSRVIEKQEASGLFSSLGIETPLSKIPIIGNILF